MTADDHKFLRYVEAHSESERHAFSRKDANRLMTMAGVISLRGDNCGLPGFVGIDQWEARRLIKLAEDRDLQTKEG